MLITISNLRNNFTKDILVQTDKIQSFWPSRTLTSCSVLLISIFPPYFSFVFSRASTAELAPLNRTQAYINRREISVQWKLLVLAKKNLSMTTGILVTDWGGVYRYHYITRAITMKIKDSATSQALRKI